MQGEAAGKARDRREPVAIQNGDVVVPGLDHDEQIERIGVVAGRLGERRGLHQNFARRRDLDFAPLGRLGQRRIDQLDQRLDLRRVQPLAERRHLGCGAAVRDDLGGVFAFQPPEVLRQQGGTHAAQARGAVTGRAVLAVEGQRVAGRPGLRLGAGRQRCGDDGRYGATAAWRCLR